RALPRHHDLRRLGDDVRIVGDDHVAGSGVLHRFLHAAQVPEAEVDDRDHVVNVPLVEGTPSTRGSIRVAASSALAKLLNATARTVRSKSPCRPSCSTMWVRKGRGVCTSCLPDPSRSMVTSICVSLVSRFTVPTRIADHSSAAGAGSRPAKRPLSYFEASTLT